MQLLRLFKQTNKQPNKQAERPKKTKTNKNKKQLNTVDGPALLN